MKEPGGCSSRPSKPKSPTTSPATTITRLTAACQEEYAAYQKRDLSDRDYVYVWADGVHFRILLEEDRLCALVMIGVRPDGTKELIAIEDGYRESTESWAGLLCGLKRRGMRAAIGPWSFERFRHDAEKLTGLASFPAEFTSSRFIGRRGDPLMLLIPPGDPLGSGRERQALHRHDAGADHVERYDGRRKSGGDSASGISSARSRSSTRFESAVPVLGKIIRYNEFVAGGMSAKSG